MSIGRGQPLWEGAGDEYKNEHNLDQKYFEYIQISICQISQTLMFRIYSVPKKIG